MLLVVAEHNLVGMCKDCGLSRSIVVLCPERLSDNHDSSARGSQKRNCLAHSVLYPSDVCIFPLYYIVLAVYCVLVLVCTDLPTNGLRLFTRFPTIQHISKKCRTIF